MDEPDTPPLAIRVAPRAIDLHYSAIVDYANGVSWEWSKYKIHNFG